jgi:hypothetical protein
MANHRVPLYDRLPEIYRIRDQEQSPPGQLRAYLELVEEAFGEIHQNIEALYHDLFIDTCDDWVIPYIGDLLGVTPLKGDPWTQRADVADTIALRRRKGTLASIERLTHNLTGWGVNCVELQKNLVWNQPLNHQRPDLGGTPPYSLPIVNRLTPMRGGTPPLRDPVLLKLLNTPLDPFAHVVDVKPPTFGTLRYNLPNLAIFLWRLQDYRVPASKPAWQGTISSPEDATAPMRLVKFDIHPLGRPVPLFNVRNDDPMQPLSAIAQFDETPRPIPIEWFNQRPGNPKTWSTETEPSEIEGEGEDTTVVRSLDAATLAAAEEAFQRQIPSTGRAEHLLAINTYTQDDPIKLANVALQLHLPAAVFAGEHWPPDQETPADGASSWQIRGADLSAWEAGLHPPMQQNRELVIDPVHGRLLFGIGGTSEEQVKNAVRALKKDLRVTYTYGAVGPIGAHPTMRFPIPQTWQAETVIDKVVTLLGSRPLSLQKALKDALKPVEDREPGPILITIQDSLTHVLNLNTIELEQPLFIRAAVGQRPIIQLKQPLRFAAKDPSQAEPITVRLEGLYLTRHSSYLSKAAWPEDEPLIAQAAINQLEVINCTLDPGGFEQINGSRAPTYPAMTLTEDYGLGKKGESSRFNQTPTIVIQRSITGSLRIDRGYRLDLRDSLCDAGHPRTESASEVASVLEGMILRSRRHSTALPLALALVLQPRPPKKLPGALYAVAGSDRPNAAALTQGCGPPTTVENVTILGRMRVESLCGRGGIWVDTLEVLNHQVGCIKFSYFCGQGDRLPQHHACVKGPDAYLRFTSTLFEQPAYGQLAHTTDFRIRERGPRDDAMGAFGCLQEAHKWRNVQIRYREFMPVGIRPLLIPVT